VAACRLVVACRTSVLVKGRVHQLNKELLLVSCPCCWLSVVPVVEVLQTKAFRKELMGFEASAGDFGSSV